MITEKLTPLQIRRIERASRNGKKEKKRIAKVSKHRSNYRWSNDSRHERRADNAESRKDRFWDRIDMHNSIEEMLEEETERELFAELTKHAEDRYLMSAKRAEALEFAICFERSFDSEEFMEKYLEDVE